MNQPDPAAVRAALAEIDAARTEYEQHQSYRTYGEWRDALIDNWIDVVIAARAWLAEQDGNNQHTRGPVDCRGMKGASE